MGESSANKFRAYFSAIADYMDRWILQTPWCSLRIHHIRRSDDDRALHDHPFHYVSWLIWGCYSEVLPADFDEARAFGTLAQDVRGPFILRRRRWLSLAVRRGVDSHRIVVERPCWTLVFSSPRYRRWGFYTADGWVYWREAEDQWARGRDLADHNEVVPRG